MKTVFIDGKAGTTGLRIYDRLSERSDLLIVTLPEELRKDENARRDALNSADITFLCLPDDAAREAVSFIESPNVTVFDTSTAHRTAAGWAYGFPELSPAHLEKIITGKRIAVPGCHASGFIALVYPLVQAGILPADGLYSCFSLTGYSGGGKKMIAEYEAEDRNRLLSAPRQYGIGQTHKHLAEMAAMTGIAHAPVFCPIVGDFYSGMEVTVPLFRENLAGGAGVDEIKAVYAALYTSPFVKFTENADESGFLAANKLSGKDSMEVSVGGNDERILLTARYDNLGKGASGAAIECMNFVLGVAPDTGLVI